MAATKKIPRLKPGDNIERAVAKIVRFRGKEIASHRDAFLHDPSPDALHDLRVALRRLQAVMENFAGALPRKKNKPFRKTIAKAIRLLGALRECDILLNELHEFRKTLLSGERPALMLLEARIELNRRRELPRVKRKMRKILDKKFFDDLSGFIAHKRLQPGRRKSPDAAFQNCLVERLAEQLETLLQNSNEVFAHPDDPKILHKLRIEAKPFRYLFEIGATMLPDLDARYGRVKHLLEILGTIHDIDTIIPNVVNHRAELNVFNKHTDNRSDRISIHGESRLLDALHKRRARHVLDAKTIVHRWKQEKEIDRIMKLTSP